jgi:hypothetical protein
MESVKLEQEMETCETDSQRKLHTWNPIPRRNLEEKKRSQYETMTERKKQ